MTQKHKRKNSWENWQNKRMALIFKRYFVCDSISDLTTLSPFYCFCHFVSCYFPVRFMMSVFLIFLCYSACLSVCLSVIHHQCVVHSIHHGHANSRAFSKLIIQQHDFYQMGEVDVKCQGSHGRGGGGRKGRRKGGGYLY